MFKKPHDKKKLESYIKLVGSAPHICETDEELKELMQSILQDAHKDLHQEDYKQLETAVNFFLLILKKRKFKGGNKQ